MAEVGQTSTRADAPPAGTPPQTAEKDARPSNEKDAMRKAGEEYFSKMLAEAGSSRLKSAKRGTSLRERRRRDVEDPDMVAVGMVIEGGKFYILSFVFVFCRAIGVLLMKESLEHLETPALLAVCHQLPLLAILWGLSLHGDINLHGISAADVQAAAPSAVFTSLALVAVLASLVHGNVLLVVAFMALMEVVTDVAVSAYLRRDLSPLPSSAQKAALGAAAVCFGVLLVTKPPQGVFTWLMLLLWTAVRGLQAGWRCICSAPEASTRLGLPVQDWAEGLRALAIAACGLDPGVHTFLAHALSVVPVLALGFLFQEGAELVDHDLSVPSVTMILMSCLCFAASEGSRLLITPGLSNTAQTFFDAFYLVAVLVMFCAQFPKEVGFMSIAAMLGVGAGITSFRNFTTLDVL